MAATITIDTLTLKLRPLTVALVEQMFKLKDASPDTSTLEQMTIVVDFIFAALARANPGLTREQLTAVLEPAEFQRVITALGSASRLEQAKPGEATSP